MIGCSLGHFEIIEPLGGHLRHWSLHREEVGQDAGMSGTQQHVTHSRIPLEETRRIMIDPLFEIQAESARDGSQPLRQQVSRSAGQEPRVPMSLAGRENIEHPDGAAAEMVLPDSSNLPDRGRDRS